MKASIVILLFVISVLLTACGSKQQEVMQSGEVETVIILEETKANESICLKNDVEESESMQSTTEEEVEEGQKLIEKICFDR